MKEQIKIVYPLENDPSDPTIKFRSLKAAIYLSSTTFFFVVSITLLLTLRMYPVQIPEHPFLMAFHYWNFFFGLLRSGFVSDGFRVYNALDKQAMIAGVAGTYQVLVFTPLVLGFICGYFVFKSAFKVRTGIQVIRGKKKLEGLEAFEFLKQAFDRMIGKKKQFSSRLILASRSGKFNPNETSIDEVDRGDVIEIPEDVRTKHHIFTGGTGRGKSQSIKYILVSQEYQKIRNGENVKMFIADTPKGDYATLFAEEDMWRWAPHEKGSIAWDMPADIYNNLVAESFWRGKIPVSENADIWPEAAIAVGTGATVFLQGVAPKAWNAGMLAYMLMKSGEELEPILTKFYPESMQILNAHEETLSSVMFNIGTYTKDLIQISRVFDGFNIKGAIYQATARALRSDLYLNFIVDEMRNDNDEAEENKGKGNPSKNEAQFKANMFKGLVKALNNKAGKEKVWAWKHLAQYLEMPVEKQIKKIISAHTLDKDEQEIFQGVASNSEVVRAWADLCANVVHYAKQWDEIENQKRLSIRDWILDEKPSKKILVLKPSEAFPTLTDSFIRGILDYSSSIILGELEDSDKRQFLLIIDEFQSYGNIKKFTSKALALFRSRGVSVSLAFQDLAQLEDTYKKEWTNFLTSNVGSIFLLGTNDGETNEKYSRLVGEATIKRPDRTTSWGAGGKSTSESPKELQNKVMTPDEFNYLGVDLPTKTIKYCYIAGGLNPVFLLEIPLLTYPKRSEPVRADWLNETYRVPSLPNMMNQWQGINERRII
ncbi:type IV secretion system DNA-binding domain-containing protein [Herbaspirillum sp. ST 5-3]|uniref:type IV secretory system conjugative DNA transfer family protein n=1 Tax=Oxalobacteraceae TaxID=75682 RepID=UPI0010A409AA|nr:type IV secretion system DNA-binding domain-containing protein [Herbaspirillum sp. ST 5-3]